VIRAAKMAERLNPIINERINKTVASNL